MTILAPSAVRIHDLWEVFPGSYAEVKNSFLKKWSNMDKFGVVQRTTLGQES